MGKAEFLAALIESAKGGRSIKNGKLYLDHPIKFTLPDGTPVEQSEIEIKGIKSLWPSVPISLLTLGKVPAQPRLIKKWPCPIVLRDN